MPSYFFHLRTPAGDLNPDFVGRLLDNDAEAFRSALRLARELARGGIEGERPQAVEIHDAGGWHVQTVPVVRH